MKVGIVVPFSWSFWGGVPEHADNQAKALFDLGVDARIIMGHDPPGRLTRALHPRMGRHERPPDYVIPVGRTVIVPANASLSNLVLTPQAMPRMKRVFEREKFDVVHLHEPLAPLLCLYALAAASCPVVVTAHSSGGRWYLFGRLWWRVLTERIDYRIAVSDQARQAAEPNIGGPFEIIPNGVVLPSDPEPGSRLPHVVFVGRHERRKGLHVLLRAWPQVAARTGARLRVIGADPLSARLLVRRLGVPDAAIDILGAVTTERLYDELLSARLLAAPSIGGESFGIVLAEAFSCATPVVASDIAGYRDVVSDEAGLLVPPGDPDALAAAIIELLEDEPRRRALGASARALAEERYSWEGIARRLVEIYESLVGGRAELRSSSSSRTSRAPTASRSCFQSGGVGP